jgi:hypothetical protein
MGSGEESILNLFKETTRDATIQEFVAGHALHPSPGVAAAGLTALSLRSDVATRSCIEKLMAIQVFNESSDRYAKRILFLTWVLVFLTLFQAVPVVGELVRFFSHQK